MIIVKTNLWSWWRDTELFPKFQYLLDGLLTKSGLRIQDGGEHK